MKKIFIGVMCAALSYLALAESVADLINGDSWFCVESGIRHNTIDGIDDKITGIVFGDECIVLRLEMTPRRYKTRMNFFLVSCCVLAGRQ